MIGHSSPPGWRSPQVVPLEPKLSFIARRLVCLPKGNQLPNPNVGSILKGVSALGPPSAQGVSKEMIQPVQQRN
jgi:hypothetical protein